jgi:hypothetical protein
MTVQAQGQRVEFSLDVSPEVYTTLNYLAQKINGGPADVLLNAIALMEIAVEAEELGKTLWIVDQDEKLDTKIVGLIAGGDETIYGAASKSEETLQAR